MRTNKKTSITAFALIAFILLSSNFMDAQEYNLIDKESSLKVFGTSNLHDWHIEAEKQNGTITFTNVADGILEKCKLEITVEDLKSGKSGMDKNTYKALNATTYKTISFQLVEVIKSIKKEEGKFAISTLGDLTISGIKKRIPLEFSISIVGNEITLIGEKTIKMTHYNVDPPKALLGTITTGDEVTIKFHNIFK